MPYLLKRALARVGVAALALGYLSTVIVAVAALVLAVGYRDQFHNLKHVIYTRCQQRDAYDTAQHESTATDIRLYQDLLAQAAQTRQLTAPELRKYADAQTQILRDALTGKQHAYAAGVIGSCNAYR